MAYTTIKKSSDYFNTKLYTGNGSTGNAQTGVGFQPDMTWLKNRDTTNDHELFDAVRGATKTIYPNRTDAEYTNASGSLTSFNSDGFTVGSGDGANKSGSGIASWNWKAGTSFTNDASATGIGSIDSTGSVNDTAGFSICTHTGTGSLGTIKHGLSTKPSVILTKERSEARDWIMYHHKNTSAPATDFLLLNTADATVDNDNFMNDTEPTSSVFTVKGFSEVNKVSQTYVSYIFSERQGYSKFGSYTGNNNSDGTFVYLGFKPAFVMFKNTTGNNWGIIDNKRDSYNGALHRLSPNTSGADNTGAGVVVDFLSNGFKCRNADGLENGAAKIIYMAFAEQPLVGDNPATAR